MAQNNRLKYYISFEADTKKAKSQIDEMMRSLQQVNAPKNVMSELFNGDDLRKARQNVAELEIMLKNAVNVDTGRLDLSKLNRSLRKSDKTLSNFAASFSQLGDEGRDAFSKITAAVLQGEAPLRRQNTLFEKMAETMHNTIRWQITSTALNAFTTAINNAYRYAEDLNRSLNDIRIVSGQSVEQMDAFADKANKAARELRTTTKAYTDAALIFYQQGLDDDEVIERTNAVMKMANVTGESATDVSSYMTAIWNNFDDGSKSLEYYGDVITKLGASTAASSEEIAGGMEKFAAVADTVGLSYEYASAALATVVAQTRQSEDVVGTSFRTIFARLSSLSLGETLEDGVTLNKYSEALDKVGVKILDQRGQLKEMDTIFDDLGAKWDELNKGQKTALATTVAGVRQYSQLIALMDNYDLFKANVNLAIDSEGTLTEQAKIFEESWLGAHRRVTAALEGIYNQLLEDDIFIFFTNGLASILELLDWVIERAGGLPGMLGLAGLAIQKVFGKDIKQVVDDLFYSIRTQMGRTQKDIGALMQNIARQNEYVQGDYDTQSMQSTLYSEQAKWASQILTTHKQITDELRDQLKVQQITNQSYIDAAIVLEQDIEKRRKANTEIQDSLPKTKEYKAETADLKAWSFSNELNSVSSSEFKEKLGAAIKNMSDKEQQALLQERFNKIGDLRNPSNRKALEQLAYDLDNPQKGTFNYDIKASFIGNKFGKLKKQKVKIRDYLRNSQAIDANNKAMLEARDRASKYEEEALIALENNDEEWSNKVNASYLKEKEKIKELKEEQEKLKKDGQPLQAEAHEINEELKQERINREDLIKLNDEQKEKVEAMFSSVASGAFKALSAYSALSAGLKALGDDSLTVEQKVTSATTSFIIGATQATSAFNEFSKAKEIFDKFEIKEGTFLYNLSDGAKNFTGVIINLLPKLGALALAFSAIIVVWKAIEKATPEYALKKVERISQDTAKAAQEAAKEYSNLKQTIDGFNDSYNAIADMTVGTEEWLNATVELNNEIQAIIDKYAILAAMEGIENTHFFENGQLVLTKEFEDFVLTQAKKQNAISILTNAGISDDAKDIEADIAVKKAKREAAEIIEGPLGTIFGSSKIETLIDEFAEGKLPVTLETLRDKLKELNIVLEDDKLKDLFNVIIEASKKTAAANSGMGAAVSPYAKQYLTDNGINIDSNIEDEYYQVLGERLDEEIDAETQKLLNIRENAPAAEYLTWTQEDVSNLFEKEVEKNWAGQYYYTDDNGKKRVLTDEEIARKKATANRYDNLENNITSSYNSDIEKAKELRRNKFYTINDLIEKDWSDEMTKTSRDKAASGFEDKDIRVYKEHLKEFTKLTERTSQFGEETARAEQMLERIAVANMRFNKGLGDIIDNWSEYKTVLQESNKGTDEYAQKMERIKTSASELLDIEKDTITDDFILQNMDLFTEAAHGSIEAVEQLRENAALAELEAASAEIKISEGFVQFKDWLTVFNENWPDLQVGASLDTTDFDSALIKLLEASGMTAKQMEEALNAIGFEPVIEYKPIDYKSAKSFGGAVYREVNGKKELVSEWDETMEDSGQFFIPTINAKQTTYRGSPKATIDATNRSKGASNASSRRKDTKKVDDEIERYHLIKETIEDLNRELDRLGKEKDRAWGNAHLQYIDREITKAQEAIDAQKEYLRQIKENYGKDRGALANYGGQFDENGRLTNYEELMRAQIAKYNAAVRSGSETQQEAAEEQYNNFKKALDKYEETADLFESEYEQLLDLQNKYYDKLLERIQYKVEIDVQISEEADKYYDYILNMLEDKAYSAAEAIAYLGKKTEESLDRIKTYQTALNEMFKMHGFGNDAYERFANNELSIEELSQAGFTAQEVDMLIKYRSALIEENKQLMEMRDQAMKSLSDTFDEYIDTLDKMIDKFDHLNTVTSAYKNIVDIVGKKVLGVSNEMLKVMDEAIVANATNTLKASKDRLDAAETALTEMARLEDEYQEAMIKANEALTEDEKLYWETSAKKIQDEMAHIEEESRNAKEAFLGDWEEALNTARELFENNVNRAIEKFEDAITGIYGSLDAMKEAYDQNKVLREQYLDEYERIYELNKLNRDITNSIDDIDSIAAKQELRDLQEEINQLQRSSAQISKYDLDMLRMRYELRLAEIALEDAQNAKSQVRMSRDNDGNWSYVYTADEATVADAAQTYEDKMMQMQQTSNDYLDQISEQWIATTIEMEQAYQKIYEDRTLSDEERMAAIDRLTEYYDARFMYFNEQITNALGNNQILYEDDWIAWANKNNLQIESNNSFLTNFGDTVLGLTTHFNTIDELHQQLLTAVGSPDGSGYLGDLNTAYTDWQENVGEIMEAAGTSANKFGEDFAKVAENTVEESENIADEVEDMADTMENAFNQVVDAVEDWSNKYASAIGENIAANSRMVESLRGLLTQINQTIDAQIKLNSVTGEGPISVTGGYGGSGNKGNEPLDDSGKKEPGYYYGNMRYNTLEAAQNRVFRDIEKEALHTDPKKRKDSKYYNDLYLKYSQLKENGGLIEKFNTGGYTGAWGNSSGKLAVLHEKELILNKDDTENFLSAINIVRDIVKIVDLNATLSGMGVGALSANMLSGTGSNVEQSVTIYADFPNATDHTEIEEAFNNIMNMASQYANRKKV